METATWRTNMLILLALSEQDGIIKVIFLFFILFGCYLYFSDQSTPFFGSYFDNVMIRVTSIWISSQCGSLFVHFCPTFRISLVLQITHEASSICQVSSGDQEFNQNQNLPSFISNQDVYLIKVPLTKSSYLSLYAHVSQ